MQLQLWGVQTLGAGNVSAKISSPWGLCSGRRGAGCWPSTEPSAIRTRLKIAPCVEDLRTVLPVGIENVDVAALRALVENRVAERKTIEYKRELPGTGDREKVRFLATVSSLANTAGGDLLLGVEAEEGVPVALSGVAIGNVDGEKLRLEQVLLSGLEPRLPRVDIHPVEIAEGRYVVLVRVPRSWVGPHRIEKNSRFYARTSGGRYELDVGELRTAFTMSESIPARIRDFRTERLAMIHGRETPVPLEPGGCIVVHAVPIRAFVEPFAIDVASLRVGEDLIRPMQSAGLGFSPRINLDGHITSTSAGSASCFTYVQVFRNGAVESACVLVDASGRMLLPSQGYEEDVLEFVSSYVKFARRFELEPPFLLFLSFVGVRGCAFGVRDAAWMRGGPAAFQDDMVVLPEVVLAAV